MKKIGQLLINKLDSEKITFISNNVGTELLEMYLSVKKDEVEFFTSVMEEAKAEALLSALSTIEFKADLYEDAQKEIARLIYFLIRDDIEEDEREKLLKPFFPDMTKRYDDFLAENLVPNSEMTFTRLIENITALSDENIGGFDCIEDAVHLERKYILRFIATLEDRDAFAFYLNSAKDPRAQHFKKFFKSERDVIDDDEVNYYDNYDALLKRLNIVMIAMYLEQFSKPFYYLKKEDLNMYQGFELELSIEEAIAALEKLSQNTKLSAASSSFLARLLMKIKSIFS